VVITFVEYPAKLRPNLVYHGQKWKTDGSV